MGIRKKIRKAIISKMRIDMIKNGVEDEDFTMSDWRYDVANGDTKLGYVDWVLHNIESHEGDEE
jgi:hypothetical protein